MSESNSEVWHDLSEMYDELRWERRATKEDKRVEYAKKELSKLGYETTYDDYNRCLYFFVGTKKCRIWPYTGWWSVKGIGSDRGVKNY